MYTTSGQCRRRMSVLYFCLLHLLLKGNDWCVIWCQKIDYFYLDPPLVIVEVLKCWNIELLYTHPPFRVPFQTSQSFSNLVSKWWGANDWTCLLPFIIVLLAPGNNAICTKSGKFLHSPKDCVEILLNTFLCFRAQNRMYDRIEIQ